MNNRQREDLDRWITGNWGEDSVPDDEDETMTIDDYARSKAQAFREKGCVCLECVTELITAACTDQKRGAVAALERIGNDGMDGELELIYKVNVWAMLMSADPIAQAEQEDTNEN